MPIAIRLSRHRNRHQVRFHVNPLARVQQAHTKSMCTNPLRIARLPTMQLKVRLTLPSRPFPLRGMAARLPATTDRSTIIPIFVTMLVRNPPHRLHNLKLPAANHPAWDTAHGRRKAPSPTCTIPAARMPQQPRQLRRSIQTSMERPFRTRITAAIPPQLSLPRPAMTNPHPLNRLLRSR